MSSRTIQITLQVGFGDQPLVTSSRDTVRILGTSGTKTRIKNNMDPLILGTLGQTHGRTTLGKCTPLRTGATHSGAPARRRKPEPRQHTMLIPTGPNRRETQTAAPTQTQFQALVGEMRKTPPSLTGRPEKWMNTCFGNTNEPKATGDDICVSPLVVYAVL